MLLKLMKEVNWTMCSSRNNPNPPHGRSSEIPRGRGVLKVKILEAKYDAKLEFPEKTLHHCGGSMDVFWNCTLYLKNFQMKYTSFVWYCLMNFENKI